MGPKKQTFVPDRSKPNPMTRRPLGNRQTTLRQITFVRNWESQSPVSQLSFNLQSILDSSQDSKNGEISSAAAIASPVPQILAEDSEDECLSEKIPEAEDPIEPLHRSLIQTHSGPIEFGSSDDEDEASPDHETSSKTGRSSKRRQTKSTSKQHKNTIQDLSIVPDSQPSPSPAKQAVNKQKSSALKRKATATAGDDESEIFAKGRKSAATPTTPSSVIKFRRSPRKRSLINDEDNEPLSEPVVSSPAFTRSKRSTNSDSEQRKSPQSPPSSNTLAPRLPNAKTTNTTPTSTTWAAGQSTGRKILFRTKGNVESSHQEEVMDESDEKQRAEIEQDSDREMVYEVYSAREISRKSPRKGRESDAQVEADTDRDGNKSDQENSSPGSDSAGISDAQSSDTENLSPLQPKHPLFGQKEASHYDTPLPGAVGQASTSSFQALSSIPTPQSGAVVRKRRAVRERSPVNESQSEKSDERGCTVRLWNGSGEQRKARDVVDIDILLNIFEETAYEMKQSLDSSDLKKALNHFAKKTQQDMRDTLSVVHNLNQQRRSLQTGYTKLHRAKKELLGSQRQEIQLMAEVAKLEKRLH